MHYYTTKARDQLGSVMSSPSLDTMRSLVEENSKLFLQTANHTINLWPAAIFACLLLVGKWTGH